MLSERQPAFGPLPEDHPFRELYFGRGVDSTTRMDQIHELFCVHGQKRRLECFAALGEAFPACDSLHEHYSWLRKLLRHATREELDAMMDDTEREAHRGLPNIVQIYRGCYAFKRNGLSWSLDQQIAAGFPFLNRFRHDTQPLLLCARVRKFRTVLKLDREEQEILVPTVRVLWEKHLPSGDGIASPEPSGNV